jgi:hypothetical protein
MKNILNQKNLNKFWPQFFSSLWMKDLAENSLEKIMQKFLE